MEIATIVLIGLLLCAGALILITLLFGITWAFEFFYGDDSPTAFHPYPEEPKRDK